MKKLLLVVLAVLIVASFCLVGCGKKDTEQNPAGTEQGAEDTEKSTTGTVNIAHKAYTEQRLTGQVMSVYLESKGFKTAVTELGGTMLCYTALQNGQVDVYAEFTGTAYGAIFDQTETISPQETYDYVKKRCEEEDGITWLSPLGWNNTYILSVRPDTADELGLKTIEDLIPYAPEYILGCSQEFLNRADGFPGLIDTYSGLEFKEELPMDPGLTYAALKNSEIDVNASFSTDGRIAKFGLVNLEDNNQFALPYYVTPILRMDYAEKNPEVVKALEELGGKWTDEDMRKYNLMVDEGEDAKVVAEMMLKDVGLID